MRNKAVHIAFILTVILVFPLFSKTFHAFASHHEQDHHIPTKELALGNENGHCTLCDYEYTPVVENHAHIRITAPNVFFELVIPVHDSHYASYTGSMVPLRGPPALPCISQR